MSSNPLVPLPQNAAILVVDRSGSMKSILSNTVIGLNTYLNEVRGVDGLHMTMLRFDTISTDIVHRRKPIADIPEITASDIEPRGGTPLIDACCIAIDTAKQEYKDSDRVVIVIMTDGHENESREFTRAELHERVKERSAVGWQFVFLGASIDAYADAGRAGISAASTMSYDARDLASNRRAYSSVAGQSVNFYETGADMSFSDQEKAAAGDAFNPGAGGGGVKPGSGGEGIKAREGAGGYKGGEGGGAKTLVDRVKL